MNWLRKKETRQIKTEELLDPTTVDLESIQGIFVKEFELNSRLKEELEMSKATLEETRQIGNEYKLKYEATLLVADEREKRLVASERKVNVEASKIDTLKHQLETSRKENNEYYLKCRSYEDERKKLRSTIENEYKDKNKEELIYHLENIEKQLLNSIYSQDGRVSKTKIIEIIKLHFKKDIDELQTVAYEEGDSDAI